VQGVAPGETAHVTLAAVDLGILNLTGFQSPDPSAHYFGQRRLGMELRDLYGRLIDGMNGAMGQVRSGGDAGARRRCGTQVRTQTRDAGVGHRRRRRFLHKYAQEARRAHAYPAP
ncbi:MAG: hypothetical protein NWQ32_05200, partial [Paracoccaceae bacterium]|nr:hypothetical protein [Paracoccaceae bacterium]